MATSPPGLNHIRAPDSLDQPRARLGQEQFDQAQAEAIALSCDEAPSLSSGNSLPAELPAWHKGPPGVRLITNRSCP